MHAGSEQIGGARSDRVYLKRELGRNREVINGCAGGTGCGGEGVSEEMGNELMGYFQGEKSEG